MQCRFCHAPLPAARPHRCGCGAAYQFPADPGTPPRLLAARGLGDVIAVAAAALGFEKCQDCAERQNWLNGDPGRCPSGSTAAPCECGAAPCLADEWRGHAWNCPRCGRSHNGAVPHAATTAGRRAPPEHGGCVQCPPRT